MSLMNPKLFDEKNYLAINQLEYVQSKACRIYLAELQLHPQHLWLIEGPNGSGKTTLLRILAGFVLPHRGEIRWCAQKIESWLLDEYQTNLHYLNHLNGLTLGLTIEENLKLAAYLYGQTLPKNYLDVLDTLSLKTCLGQPARHLSAGLQRRLGLARLWLFPRQVWLLDEPLTNLDQAIQKIFFSHLHSHLAQGGMVIMSSHHALNFPTSLAMQKIRLG